MPRKTKPYHHGDLREALVSTGGKLLKEKGQAGLTLRACARAAGVSHAAPQHHFKSVDDLLAEIAARGFESFVAQLNSYAATATEPGAKLEAMCHAYVKFALEDGAVYSLMFRQGSSQLQSSHLREAAMAAWMQLASAVAAVIGPAHENEIPVKAAYVWSLVHGLATLLLDRRIPPVVDTAMLVDSMFKGLAATLKADSRPA